MKVTLVTVFRCVKICDGVCLSADHGQVRGWETPKMESKMSDTTGDTGSTADGAFVLLLSAHLTPLPSYFLTSGGSAASTGTSCA